jgi:hypothetical protein
MSMQWKTPQAKAKPKGKPKEAEAVDPRAIDRLIKQSQQRHDRSAQYGFGYTYSPETLAYAAEMERQGEYLIASATKTLERSKDPRPHAKFLADLKDLDDGKDLDSIESTSTTLTQDECQWEEDLVPDHGDFVPRVAGKVEADPEEEEEDTESSDLEVIGTLTPDASGKARSLCESLFLLSDKSLPELIAMAQGVSIRHTDIMFDGRDGLMFDLDGDDLLKTFAHRGSILPKVVHLRVPKLPGGQLCSR